MKTFTIVTHPLGTFAVVDDSALAEPEVYAEKDNGDRHGERLRALVDQANIADELLHQLCTALPFVEDMAADPCYKPGKVRDALAAMRIVINRGIALERQK